jgi:hypothetical protein
MGSIYNDATIELFKSITSYFHETTSHFVIRCPYCGDSRKRSSVGHLYISKQDPIFRCNRCGFGHRVDRLLRDVLGKRVNTNDIVRDDVSVENLSKYDYSNTITYRKITPIEHIRLFECDYKNQYKYKYEYIKNRLDFEFEKDTIISNSIIFDIKNTILKNDRLYKKILTNKNNDIVKTNNFINFLEQKFVGFLTYKKNTMILRNIDDNDKFRYYKLILNDKFTDYYVIDTLINNFEEIPRVVIAEGIFDILLPYLKIMYSNENFDFLSSRLFVASGGKSFIEAIKFIAVQKTIAQFEVIILSDNSDDVKISMYDKVYNKCKNLIKRMVVMSNLCDKDFGVKNIEPCIIKIY